MSPTQCLHTLSMPESLVSRANGSRLGAVWIGVVDAGGCLARRTEVSCARDVCSLSEALLRGLGSA